MNGRQLAVVLRLFVRAHKKRLSEDYHAGRYDAAQVHEDVIRELEDVLRLIADSNPEVP